MLERGLPASSLLVLFLIFIFFFTTGRAIYPEASQRHTEILSKLQKAMADPQGLEFHVRWQYEFGADSWSGQGTLLILGNDYLRLSLPYEEILVRKTMVMTRYNETDQVIMDYFDRDDPSNLLSILLGDFDAFNVGHAVREGNSSVDITLHNETMVGFDELKISVDERTWLPNFIIARAGDDIKVTIDVRSVRPLGDPQKLVEATLTGSEVIDLRE